MINAEFVAEIRETSHRGADDLLSAGVGLIGLRARPTGFANPDLPTSTELRRRAIHASWQAIGDLATANGFGMAYGAVPIVPGREYATFATLDGATTSHRIIAQMPDAFDARTRCLIVAPASGSRGAYGAIGLAGSWGLPRGCAVTYTDKGAGSGYFDLDSQTGVMLDGRRAARGEAVLEFQPAFSRGSSGIASKHAHSGDHPEADWGRHVLQAAHFGLAMMDRAYPALAPFTADNTCIIAVGLSNGGGAVLRAAGIDDAHVLDAVVAIAPNVHVSNRGRALVDFATEAALLLPVALLDARFDAIPFARLGNCAPASWVAQRRQLRERGLIEGASDMAGSSNAVDGLLARGWTWRALETAAISTAFELWRSIGATYLSSYLRTTADAMPCGLGFAALDGGGRARATDAATRAAWWSDANGIPAGAGVALVGPDGRTDASIETLLALRALCSETPPSRAAMSAVVAETATGVPRDDLPVLLVHGESDGLLPITLTSDAYIAMLRDAGRSPGYWRVPSAQHFDAFLALPGFGERHEALLPHAYAALDAVWARLMHDTPFSLSSPRSTVS